MRILIQRVTEATLSVEGILRGVIGHGLLALAGIHADDGQNDIEWLVRRIVGLRVFNDDAGVMNRSVRHGGVVEPKILAGKDLTVKDAEKQLIIRALKETDSNRTRAAQKIGMSRRTFHRKLHEYHLEGF